MSTTAPKVPEDDRPILVMGGGPTQVPLWRPLNEHYRIVFLYTQAAMKAFEMGVTTGPLEKVVDKVTEIGAQNQAMWLVSIIMDELTAGNLATLDPAVETLRTPGLGNWFPMFAYELLTTLVVRVTALRYLHENDGIVGVVLHEDVTPDGRLLAQFGRAHGIPTLHIPHANHFIQPGTGDIHCQTTAEHLGVAGEHMYQWYRACGVGEDRLTVLGASQWDWLYDPEMVPTREHARRALGFKQDDLILAYATTWFQDTSTYGAGWDDLNAAFYEMLAAVKALDAKLLVKMHPGEMKDREEFYKLRMNEAGVAGTITRIHNEHMGKASDCLVTLASSNIAVEAGILGCPVVEHWQCGTRYPTEYDIPGTWGSDLVPAIEQAMEAGPNEVFVRAMNYDHDGGAKERTVAWVRELCPV